MLWPFLAVIALAIVIDSWGNPLYGARRAGKGGIPFRMWKFRTMVVDADRVGPPITANSDPRVTRLGRLLRATKLDEFPAFINVLWGDMTLVGPRPEVPTIVAQYSAAQRRVLDFTPGVTGVGAIHYTTTQSPSIPDGIAADVYYIEHLLDEKLAMEIEYEEHRTLSTDMGMLYSSLLLVLKAILAPARIVAK